MNRLFAVLLRGRAKGCNTEVHDIVFVVGQSLEETYTKLINKWFGSLKELYIDAFVELRFVDQYEIILKNSTATQEKQLFFVSFRAHKPDYCDVNYKSGFYVARSKREAKEKAKNMFYEKFPNHSQIAIDDIIPLKKIDKYYIALQETAVPSVLNFVSFSQRLDTQVAQMKLMTPMTELDFWHW